MQGAYATSRSDMVQSGFPETDTTALMVLCPKTSSPGSREFIPPIVDWVGTKVVNADRCLQRCVVDPLSNMKVTDGGCVV